MSVELREIPPAPRAVQWSAVLWRRWPLLPVGMLLAVYGGLLTLLFAFSESSSFHASAERLLEEKGIRTTGVADAVTATVRVLDHTLHDKVHYRFDVPGRAEYDGESFCATGTVAAGATVEVDYLETEPSISRIVGGHLVFLAPLTGAAVWLGVVPGLALLAVWGCGVLRLRRVLRDGDAAIAEPTGVRRVWLMVPTMLDVRFRFRDRHAVVREGRSWVRARSALGQRLTAPSRRPESRAARVLWRPGQRIAPPTPTDWRALREDTLPRLVVIHDRERPHVHRLVAPDDFERAAAAERALPPRAWLG